MHNILNGLMLLFFPYGDKEIAHLKKRDKKLAAAIESIGIIERIINPDPFSALLHSIVSQQISNKAAATVWQRLSTLAVNMTPQVIQDLADEEIQRCGLSLRKVSYIKGIAAAALSGHIDFAELDTLTDGDVISKLTTLKGVGEWTAEMLLIFSLARPDVLSYKDLAIKKGIMNLYGYKEVDPAKFERLRRRYSPYASTASLYLWYLSHESL